MLLFRIISLAIALATLGVCTAAEPPFGVADGLFDPSNAQTLGLSTVLGEHAEIHLATEESGFRFSHHPSLVIFKDRLYCSWSSGRAHEDRPDQRVLISSSADGKTWAQSETLAEPLKGSADSYIASGFHVDQDTLVAYYTIRHDYPEHNLYNPKNGLFARTSTDGLNWGEPKKVVSGGFFIEGPQRLPNGRLMLGGEHAGENWKSHQARMRLLFSDTSNGIAGWKDAGIDPAAAEPKGLKVFGYTEPCPFVREDGVIVCPFRNESGFLYGSVSRDNGETWSVPQQTNFPDSMARFNTGRLPDGRFYLINNPGPGKMNRGTLAIALSEDGVLFDRAWIIRNEPTTQRFSGKGKKDGWQYPNSLVWNDSLFVVYSVNKEDVWLTRIRLDALSAD
ncbi:MAG: hypothetical protein ACI8UO_001812 [Verrucomicrobiales bacterium]|jgi:hypothetical protein